MPLPVLLAVLLAAPLERPFAPDLRAFNGVDYLAAPEVMRDLGLGWARESFPCDWNAVEPEPDRWDFAKMDARVAEAHAQGVEVLPMLGYTARWAAGELGGFGPARDVADWEDYVAHVVARYSRPPYNLRWFQVWNEPTWAPMDFWKATGPEWIDEVYLPAARIIRRYGCRVVFGGWAGVDAGHLNDALDWHDAWRFTDIIDVHYCGIGIWQSAWDRYLKDGRCLGVWQTEIGFHPFPEYIANLYPRALYWALTHGWSDDPDRYKLFWFASWGAGPDGPKCLTLPGGNGNVLTEHGKRMRALTQVLGDGQLRAFDDYTTDPPLPPTLDEEQPTAVGFRVGRRLVIALIVDAETLKAHPVVTVTVPKVVGQARLVTSAGVSREQASERTGAGLVCRVPMGELDSGVARSWGREWRVAVGYLVLE
ncbi:MAG: hypothetical protein HYU66_27350 [Armatimonadetes bacterium]|nr:hypothetical protein [Armatimonadota bacterium]